MFNKIILNDSYNNIISIENLLLAWREFIRQKKNRKDVQEFELYLMKNIIILHQELYNKKYKHSDYQAFTVADPKPRNIHKASVRDRLLHHALYRILYPFFDKTFISDSFSCRLKKGTHKAIERFNTFARKESCNNTKTVWILKCDIRKFFASVDQEILIKIIRDYIKDGDIVSLVSEIVGSFQSTKKGVGLPLGNLTSQLLVNVYMNKFDQFVKYKLKAKYYIRYADDFVIFSRDKELLIRMVEEIKNFLFDKLHLELHPNKVSIETLASGVDYLGWVHFPKHRVLRTVTKKRMMREIINKKGKKETMQSYLGMLGKGNARKIEGRIWEMMENIKML
jgi:RNA-directed DNA polymerase